MSGAPVLSVAELANRARSTIDRGFHPEACDALDEYLTPAAVLDLCGIVEAAAANEDALVKYHQARTEKRGIDDALDRLRVSRYTLRLALRKVAP